MKYDELYCLLCCHEKLMQLPHFKPLKELVESELKKLNGEATEEVYSRRQAEKEAQAEAEMEQPAAVLKRPVPITPVQARDQASTVERKV